MSHEIHGSKEEFQLWCARVDALMKHEYVVGLVDVGWTPDDLRKFWQRDETANEFVEWFALKYDLDPYTPYGYPSLPSGEKAH